MGFEHTCEQDDMVPSKSEKKNTILTAARTRFRKYGINKTNMLEIAQDAGMAVGTLYLYFKNKDELIIGCADQFRERHLSEAKQVNESQLTAAEKIKQYLLLRYRANHETRTSSEHDAEIARCVLRLKPDRIAEESSWFYTNICAFLDEGVRQSRFHIADTARDTEIFLYSIAYFFPLPGKEPPQELTEQALGKVIDWFIETWSRN